MLNLNRKEIFFLSNKLNSD